MKDDNIAIILGAAVVGLWLFLRKGEDIKDKSEIDIKPEKGDKNSVGVIESNIPIGSTMAPNNLGNSTAPPTVEETFTRNPTKTIIPENEIL